MYMSSVTFTRIFYVRLFASSFFVFYLCLLLSLSLIFSLSHFLSISLSLSIFFLHLHLFGFISSNPPISYPSTDYVKTHSLDFHSFLDILFGS